jgi:hypothetical protein
MSKTVYQATSRGFVTGRNGYFDCTGVQVSDLGTKIRFDCCGKSGKILNAGFSIGRQSFLDLCVKLGIEYREELPKTE